ncbi:helix-turn-helix domain-containing protein [Streptomyces sp. CB02460]|uniref:helix-turn-helix domain-containing protein n=1 Tax=Streptomyces sp. CB02460 TaxID=1703941 RepID=UPI000939B2B8|nr:helix-turn-helix domain-containing protein [Streptomyces sp. CB02460]OKJ78533.1 excisionase [Streptomyces sp. CB02460]
MTKTDIRPVKLPPEKTAAANRALTRVRGYLTEHPDLAQIAVKPLNDSEREPLTLPREAVELLAGLLAHLGAGRGVSIVPSTAELTTQQAADILNVSRPFLIGLLEAGEIECRMVGTHRRITASSLMEYKQADDRRRREAADELSQLGQEMGLT